MDKIHDKWIRIGGVALLLLPLLINEITSAGFRRAFWDEVIYVTLYTASVVLILEISRSIILALHKKYTEPANSKKRFQQACSFVLTSNFFLILFTFYLSHWIRGMQGGHELPFFFAVLIASLVLALAQVGIYEGLYYFTRLRKVEQEKEALLRINLERQFDSLKQQVNPHFLFNSINTVSSLIGIDPLRAQKFLAEMSKVYRYLLKANEEELTTLEKELEFLASYFHLLKTRFGEGLHLDVEVDKDSKACLLPVLSLQLLMENAVKHNAIDAQQPLLIKIALTPSRQLCIKNNLQKKMNVIGSNKVGLSSILAKYKLLNQQQPIIRETDTEFIVILPLIQTNVYERINR